MEGLSSNFFALSAAGEVVTADEGVLGGTIRELVLQARAALRQHAARCAASAAALRPVPARAARGPAGRRPRRPRRPRAPPPQACADEGIPVRLEPPLLADAGRWGGAFISSTSRLLLPADELRWAPPGHAAHTAAGGPGPGPHSAEKGGAAALEGSDAECVRRFEAQHPLVVRLEAAVAARILEESEEVPLPP